MGAAIVWAYWPTLADMQQRWADDPQYSHGYLVPVFAGVLLWLRRAQRPTTRVSLSWWGIPFLLTGAATRLAGVYLYVTWVEGISLLPTLAGVALLVGGWPCLRWSWPAIAFLFFMVPLPFRVQTALAGPLQHLATELSTFALQTLGLPALAEGNVIILSQVRLGVVDACSGLTMLMTFFALATGVLLVVERPWLDRMVVMLCAGPIAVLANVIRITLTGVMHETVGTEMANAVFHEWAGYLMMIVALVMIGLVLKVLSHLLLAPAPKELLPLDLNVMTMPTQPPAKREPAVVGAGSAL